MVMDRQRALAILDAVRPDSDDLNDAEFAEAVSFLNSNEQCAAEFARRQKFDAQLGQSMRNVDVPVYFKDQLLAVLRDAAASHAEQQELASNRPDIVSPTENRLNKKSVLRVVISMTACLLVAASFWIYNSAVGNQYEVDELQQLAAVHLDDWQNLPDFSGSSSPSLPGYGWSNSRINSSPTPLGLPVTSESNRAIALYGFQVASGTSSHAEGLLLVVERGSVSNPPALTHFSSGNVRYINNRHGKFAAVTWSDNRQVYICIVRNTRTLERIATALRATPA